MALRSITRNARGAMLVVFDANTWHSTTIAPLQGWAVTAVFRDAAGDLLTVTMSERAARKLRRSLDRLLPAPPKRRARKGAPKP